VTKAPVAAGPFKFKAGDTVWFCAHAMVGDGEPVKQATSCPYLYRGEVTLVDGDVACVWVTESFGHLENKWARDFPRVVVKPEDVVCAEGDGGFRQAVREAVEGWLARRSAKIDRWLKEGVYDEGQASAAKREASLDRQFLIDEAGRRAGLLDRPRRAKKEAR